MRVVQNRALTRKELIESLSSWDGSTDAKDSILKSFDDYQAERSSGVLNLEDKDLSSIPDIIGRMSFLHTLKIGFNKNLVTLPDSIFSWSNLRNLSAQHCSIEAIPSAIIRAQNLEQLILANNKITRIAPELNHLDNLNELSLSGNPLGEAPNRIGGLSFIDVPGQYDYFVYESSLKLFVDHLKKCNSYSEKVCTKNGYDRARAIALIETIEKLQSQDADPAIYIANNERAIRDILGDTICKVLNVVIEDITANSHEKIMAEVTGPATEACLESRSKSAAAAAL